VIDNAILEKITIAESKKKNAKKEWKEAKEKLLISSCS